MAEYYFRDDMEAEKERQAAAGPTTLAPVAPTATPTAPVAPKAPDFAALGKAAAGPVAPKAPAAKPDYFADFRASLDAQNPFKQQLQGAVSQTLQNPTAAFDAQASAERDRQAREASAAQEEARQANVLAYGGNQTGQVDRQMGILKDKQTLQSAEFGRDVAAGRAQAAETARANALQQGTALLGQEQQAAAQAAGIGLQQEGLAQDAALTREGYGLTREEGAAQRATQEKLTYAQIGSQEKLQGAAQVFEAAQADLNRGLEKLLSNDRIAAQFQLADMDARLQERMQTAGFVNAKELETMRTELQDRLQARGIQADVAKQIADQKFTEMMAGRDQAFQMQMNDIKQKFISGERIDAQTWEGAMRASEMQHDEVLAKLNSTLRLEEAGNAQAFQTAFQQMQNDFTALRDDRGFAHEDAMRVATEQFQMKLQEAGFTQEQAMQGAQLAAQASENQKSRASQEMMAAAQLALTDKNFQSELQQRYQFNAEDLALRTKELEGQLGLMGLQGEQLKAALGDQKIRSAMDIVALGMEIGDGSPESMAPFVEQFGAALEGYMKGQGIDIASSDFVKAMTAKTGAGGTTTPPAPATIATVQEGVDTLKTLTDKLGQGTDVKKLSDSLSKLGTWWNSNGGNFYKSGGIEGFMSDPSAVAMVMNTIGPLYKAGLDKATIRQVAAFLPGDVIDRVLGNAGVQ